MSAPERPWTARLALLPDEDERWGGHVRVPALLRPDRTLVTFENAKWPRVSTETLVEVVIPARALAEEPEKSALLAEREVELLPANYVLLAAVSPSGVPGDLRQHLKRQTNTLLPNCEFVEVVLKSPLGLRLRANGRSSLADVECEIPSIRTEAKSLNQAYRLLSQQFEPKRRSYGGSVFLRVLYLDHGMWLPLDALRRWAELGGDAREALGQPDHGVQAKLDLQ